MDNNVSMYNRIYRITIATKRCGFEIPQQEGGN